MQIQSTKDKTCTRENYTASSLSAMLEQARRHARQERHTLHDARDRHDTCWELISQH